jgi:predicted HicB family RNase H-like nuclease
MKMVTKAQLEGNKRYHEKFDDIKIRVPKGEREKLHTHAGKMGESLTGYIIRAIYERMERDILPETESPQEERTPVQD